jgi:hypothetical protein
MSTFKAMLFDLLLSANSITVAGYEVDDLYETDFNGERVMRVEFNDGDEFWHFKAQEVTVVDGWCKAQAADLGAPLETAAISLSFMMTTPIEPSDLGWGR